MKKLCNTRDREQAFNIAKYYVLNIRQGLQAFFNNQSFDVSGDRKWQKRIKLDVDYYLHFYILIRNIWQYLTIENQKDFRSSGELLINIINNDIFKYFYLYFPEWRGNYFKEYSTNKYRTLLKTERELSSLINDESAVWSRSQVNKLNNYLKQKRKTFKDESIFNYHQLVVLSVANRHYNSDRSVKRNLDILNDIYDEIKKMNFTLCHPKHKFHNWSVNYGVKTEKS